MKYFTFVAGMLINVRSNDKKLFIFWILKSNCHILRKYCWLWMLLISTLILRQTNVIFYLGTVEHCCLGMVLHCCRGIEVHSCFSCCFGTLVHSCLGTSLHSCLGTLTHCSLGTVEHCCLGTLWHCCFGTCFGILE